jgi:hypothetical protein
MSCEPRTEKIARTEKAEGVFIETEQLEMMPVLYPHIDYVNVVKMASEGSEKDIYLLCSLEFDGAFAYDHGSVLVDIIDILGEDKCVDMMKDINKQQAEYFVRYLSVGLEYGHKYGSRGNNKFDPEFDYKIKDIFPKIDSLLRSKLDQ